MKCRVGINFFKTRVRVYFLNPRVISKTRVRFRYTKVRVRVFLKT